MAKLNLGAFERQIRVRQLRLEDWDAFRRLEETCFPGMEGTTREQLTSQITRFPEGPALRRVPRAADDRFEKELAERRAGMARPRLPRPAGVDGRERALRG